MYFLMSCVLFNHPGGGLDRLDRRGIGHGGRRIWHGVACPRRHWIVPLGGVLGFAAVGFSGDVGFAVANVIWLTQTAMIVLTGGLGYVLLFLHRMRRG